MPLVASPHTEDHLALMLSTIYSQLLLSAIKNLHQEKESQECCGAAAAGRSRQASSPHHQIGFGFVSDGVFAKVKKSTNTETAMLSKDGLIFSASILISLDMYFQLDK